MSTTILTIDPGTRFWGICLFFGEEIVLWKVRNLSTKDSSQKVRLSDAGKIFLSLCKKYNPDVVILKRPYVFWERQSLGLGKITNEIKRLATKNGIRIREFSGKDIRKSLCQKEVSTKTEIVEAIRRKYCEVGDFLFESQKDKDRYQWSRAVNSIALGLCYFSKQSSNGRKHSS